MKTLSAFFALLVIGVAAPAQTLQVLHNFGGGQGNPISPLVEGRDGNFYGTTPSGGSAGLGRVFRMTRTGAVTTLVSFTGANGQAPWTVGLTPDRDGNLYGATVHGGTGRRGTVFKVTLDGALTTLVHFNDSNGAVPGSLAIGNDGNLYGTTITGTNYYGTVFKVKADGTFGTLLNFPVNYGSFPAELIAGRDGHLYGRTFNGNSGIGTVFRVTTNGTLTTLATLFGNDHAYSIALVEGNDGNFYGTTIHGGTSGGGTAFRMTPEGRLTTLVNFVGSNGTLPTGPLRLGDDGNFYGTTAYGGIFEGTVFKMTPDGTLITLANFTSRSSGVRPFGGATFGTDGSLYGTTYTGGNGDGGVIFRLDLPPRIISQPASQTNVPGATVTFTVSATGTRPISYQWLKDGMSLVDGGNASGASTATLTLANAQLSDSGSFAVIVTNNFGSVTSAAAVLVVTLDSDGDGVLDHQDSCPDSPPGAAVNEQGCSVEQLAPCDGPQPGVRWRNHGEYVGAVARLARNFVAQGLISEAEALDIVEAAARSDCGKR